MNKFFLILSVIVMTATEIQSTFAEITKEKLFATPDFISAKVSPNGKLIAKVGADESGIANVAIFPVDTSPLSSKQLTFFKTPSIIQFFWSADSKKVLLLKDENGTGQLNLYGADVESQELISYTKPFSGVNTKVIKISPLENKAVIGLNHRNPHFHDLYTLDFDSGQFTFLLQNDHYAKFLISDELEVILKVQIHNNGSWTVFSNNEDRFLSLSPEEAFQTEFLSYSSLDKAVYFLDNRFSNTNQLTRKNIEAPYKEKVLGAAIESDIDEVILAQGKPKAYASYYTQKKWHILDATVQKDILFLVEKVGNNFELISQDQSSAIWILRNSIPDKGVDFWVYKRSSRSLTQISTSDSDQPEDYAKMYEMVVRARDGEKLVCYYTLPKEHDQGGYTKIPIPLVVVPHGGPFKIRDKFEFNPYHQWLASCGYAALSVNFRLSSGFGKDFVNAGNGQWGKKAHLDIIDAVEACIAKKLTKKEKLAVFGGSYGGYESLAALTFTPKYFTCAVAICGPSNLKTVLKSVPKFWEFPSAPLSDRTLFFTKQAFITSMGGDPESEKGSKYLEECSPLNYIGQIQSPLLLVHGKNDHVVVESESKQIYENMKKRKKNVTYILFPNEGHGFSNFSNKMMYLDQAESFLAEYLHGKYRPIKKSLVDTSTGSIFN